MRMTEIIEKKRDGAILSSEEIKYFISEYTKGNIPDYQASALLMAIYLNGMTSEETATLTMEMAHSGDLLNLDMFGERSADKHSSGGIGDKTSLIVAPIAASCGVVVAKMSGRGLGYTGGTVDKLESIKGFKTSVTPEDFINQIKKIGIAMVGQSGNMAPADKKLYALRDVTSTVECLPLIVSSIMSKKIAAGAKNIILDVKCGSGAFMKTEENAKALATEMVKIGKKCNRNVVAFITEMGTPLGRNIGNSLEVIEAVEVLKGKEVFDLKELSIKLSAGMIAFANNVSFEEGEKLAKESLESGKAYKKLLEMVSAQGGDISYLEDTEKFPKAKCSYEIKAKEDGFVSSLDALKIGEASVILGAGREKKEDAIDYSAGIILNKKIGEEVKSGEVLATLFASDEEKFKDSKELALSAYKISKNKVQIEPLIKETVR